MDHRAMARRIHAAAPVVDGHNDLAWALRKRAGRGAPAAPPRTMPDLHTDVERLRRGGVGVQFWSVFVPAWTREPFAATLGQVDLVDDLIATFPEDLEKAWSTGDIETVRHQGRIASIPGAEGGHSIENSLDKLRRLAERGVRYLTLTHNDSTDWADSATDTARSGGLSRFGREVVADMNRLGMLVDISHVAPTTMRDAIATSEAPVIASHSSAHALAPHPRNIPDDVLEQVGATGGVVMVNFYPPFVVRESAIARAGLLDRIRELQGRFADDTNRLEAEVEELLARHPVSRGSVRNVVDHIEHIARIAGVDAVGLGSDFDGIDMTPDGLESVADFPNITAELLRRGWAEPEIRKVLGRNALRVIAAADEVAGS